MVPLSSRSVQLFGRDAVSKFLAFVIFTYRCKMDSATQRCLDGMRKIQRNDKEVDSAWVQTYYEENCGQVSFLSKRFYA